MLQQAAERGARTRQLSKHCAAPVLSRAAYTASLAPHADSAQSQLLAHPRCRAVTRSGGATSLKRPLLPPPRRALRRRRSARTTSRAPSCAPGCGSARASARPESSRSARDGSLAACAHATRGQVGRGALRPAVQLPVRRRVHAAAHRAAPLRPRGKTEAAVLCPEQRWLSSLRCAGLRQHGLGLQHRAQQVPRAALRHAEGSAHRRARQRMRAGLVRAVAAGRRRHGDGHGGESAAPARQSARQPCVPLRCVRRFRR